MKSKEKAWNAGVAGAILYVVPVWKTEVLVSQCALITAPSMHVNYLAWLL